MPKYNYLNWAVEAMHTEADSIKEVARSLNQDFVLAAETLLHCQGRVIVTGMGKSGHIGRKIAATFASTGTPAFFVHPAEAAHGDLGMITDGDAILALSNSGESDEILALIPALKRKNITLICITARTQSTMAQYADIHICAAVSREACPLGLAPTSSTTAVLALGDALAIVLLKARSFTSADFALSHPAGSLGRRLLLTVGDIMHTGDCLPTVLPNTELKTAVITMSSKGLGMLTIVDEHNRLLGIFTDGDLRRLFESRDHFNDLTVGDVMIHNPTSATPNTLAAEAVKIMQQKRIGCLPITDTEERLKGALNMHDLLKARIV